MILDALTFTFRTNFVISAFYPADRESFKKRSVLTCNIRWIRTTEQFESLKCILKSFVINFRLHLCIDSLEQRQKSFRTTGQNRRRRVANVERSNIAAIRQFNCKNQNIPNMTAFIGAR